MDIVHWPVAFLQLVHHISSFLLLTLFPESFIPLGCSPPRPVISSEGGWIIGTLQQISNFLVPEAITPLTLFGDFSLTTTYLLRLTEFLSPEFVLFLVLCGILGCLLLSFLSLTILFLFFRYLFVCCTNRVPYLMHPYRRTPNLQHRLIPAAPPTPRLLSSAAQNVTAEVVANTPQLELPRTRTRRRS